MLLHCAPCIMYAGSKDVGDSVAHENTGGTVRIDRGGNRGFGTLGECKGTIRSAVDRPVLPRPGLPDDAKRAIMMIGWKEATTHTVAATRFWR